MHKRKIHHGRVSQQIGERGSTNTLLFHIPDGVMRYAANIVIPTSHRFCLHCTTELPRFTVTNRLFTSSYCNKSCYAKARHERTRGGKPKVWRGIRRAGL